jgi:hypothetical protein
MPKSPWWVVVLCALTVLLHGSASAQTQKRNFNLNCGLIGSFARYPQHNHGCKAVVLCTDPKTCLRKFGVRKKALAILPLEELGTPVAGEAPSQSYPSSNGLSLSVDARTSVSAGGLNASGSISGGVDSSGAASGSISGGAGADSSGATSGSANAGASADGGQTGGGNATAGGGLGVGGL